MEQGILFSSWLPQPLYLAVPGMHEEGAVPDRPQDSQILTSKPYKRDKKWVKFDEENTTTTKLREASFCKFVLFYELCVIIIIYTLIIYETVIWTN